MKLSALKKAGREIIEGKWVDNLPNLPPEVGFLVVGLQHPEVRKFTAEAYRALTEEERKDNDKLEAIQRDQIKQVLVRGWRGITDEAGADIPFNKESLTALVDDPWSGPMIVPAINTAVEKVGVVEAEAEKADAKN
jgi:hypothetical protein